MQFNSSLINFAYKFSFLVYFFFSNFNEKLVVLLQFDVQLLLWNGVVSIYAVLLGKQG